MKTRNKKRFLEADFFLTTKAVPFTEACEGISFRRYSGFRGNAPLWSHKAATAAITDYARERRWQPALGAGNCFQCLWSK